MLGLWGWLWAVGTGRVLSMGTSDRLEEHKKREPNPTHYQPPSPSSPPLRAWNDAEPQFVASS